MDRIAIAAALWLLPGSLYGQWLDLPTPGIPRAADGRPNLAAPTPRTPDGKWIGPACGNLKQTPTVLTSFRT